jgi:hypothetical protein
LLRPQRVGILKLDEVDLKSEIRNLRLDGRALDLCRPIRDFGFRI